MARSVLTLDEDEPSPSWLLDVINVLGGAVFDVCVRYLQENPGASWKQALDASAQVRQEVYAWLFDGSTLKPLAVKKSNNTAVLEGTTVKLKQEAADLLNMTFGITVYGYGQYTSYMYPGGADLQRITVPILI